MREVHLAQVNIARGRAPLDHASMAEFVRRIDEINALAEGSPGFVWRLATPAGNALYIRPYDDDRILFNLSVWQSVEALHQFVYRTAHSELFANRHQWFERFGGATSALWWIPAGHIPDVAEAKQRLALLDQNGPTAQAFTFKTRFPPQDSP
jgi:hypothetical protein